MKKISVSISGADDIRDIELESGTTAADILAALNLNNYQLLPEPSGTPFSRTESIYGKVEDGDKLFAIPDSDVGGQRSSYVYSFSFSGHCSLLGTNTLGR